jgi:hypothetical protein
MLKFHELFTDTGLLWHLEDSSRNRLPDVAETVIGENAHEKKSGFCHSSNFNQAL